MKLNLLTASGELIVVRDSMSVRMGMFIVHWFMIPFLQMTFLMIFTIVLGKGLMMFINPPLLDITVDTKKEKNGYLPGVKRMYSEHVFYDGCYRDSQKYEDRGVKHLYEFHHCCSSSSEYCNSFCNVTLREGNHKLNDVFHVENEEIVCLDSAVNYDKLHDFHIEQK